jgi:proteasome lid subunit RPN8/RPN11
MMGWLRDLFKKEAPPRSPRPDGKTDWSDVGMGPNLREAKKPKLTPKLAHQLHFAIDAEVSQKFNAYASAAFPREIGGLLRVVEEEPGYFRAIDIRIFPHLAATGAYFELDGVAVAQFNMELVRAGRANEVEEWRSLIHSHPGFAPFLSGTDRTNLKRLAGPGFAFSVICSARKEGLGNYYALHYAQGGHLPLVVCDIATIEGEHLEGTELLSPDDKNTIGAEVQQYLPKSTFTTSLRTPKQSKPANNPSDPRFSNPDTLPSKEND